jgi:hypothetical protein
MPSGATSAANVAECLLTWPKAVDKILPSLHCEFQSTLSECTHLLTISTASQNDTWTTNPNQIWVIYKIPDQPNQIIIRNSSNNALLISEYSSIYQHCSLANTVCRARSQRSL